MLKRILPWIIGMCLVCKTTGETIRLAGGAVIEAPVLLNQEGRVVVDLGYDVLVLPRRAVSEVLEAENPGTGGGSDVEVGAISKVAPVAAGFYVASEPLPEKSVRMLVTELGEGVVQVRTPGGLGSGFIINEEGYLITNFHVIEGETRISVEVYRRPNGGALERVSYQNVRIVAMNRFADLALLKIEEEGSEPFSYVLLGDSDALEVGEHVFAIGSPLGLERTVTEGIVSTKTRQMQGSLYLQTTAQINPGNSGGPLFNLKGEVVGVTNMKLNFAEGLGFAIPVDEVRFFLKHRDAFAYDNDNPNNAYNYLPPPGRKPVAQVNSESEK